MSSDFLPFASQLGANVLNQTDWAALVDRGMGFQAGRARSAAFNKVWRQTSVMVAAVGQFIDANIAGNVVDDGNVTALTAQLTQAVGAVAGTGNGGSGGVTSITVASPLTGGTITGVGNIGLGTVGIANGGTAATTRQGAWDGIVAPGGTFTGTMISNVPTGSGPQWVLYQGPIGGANERVNVANDGGMTLSRPDSTNALTINNTGSATGLYVNNQNSNATRGIAIRNTSSNVDAICLDIDNMGTGNSLRIRNAATNHLTIAASGELISGSRITASALLTVGTQGPYIACHNTAVANQAWSTYGMWVTDDGFLRFGRHYAGGGGSVSYLTMNYSGVFTFATQIITANLQINGPFQTSGGAVTYGANDSAGAGYRVLRVPNQ